VTSQIGAKLISCYAMQFNKGGININTSVKTYVIFVTIAFVGSVVYSLISLNNVVFREVIYLTLAFTILHILLNREAFGVSTNISTSITLPITLPAIIYLEPLFAGIYVFTLDYLMLRKRKLEKIKLLFNICSKGFVVIFLALIFQKELKILLYDTTSPIFFLSLLVAGALFSLLSNGLTLLAFMLQMKKIDMEVFNSIFTSIKTSGMTIFLGIVNVFIFYYFGILGIAISTFFMYFIKPVINFQSILNNELSTFTDFVLHTIKLYDPITHSHSERVKKWTIIIAKEMKLSNKQIHELSQAASWHDIGKIEIPNEIISKDGKLTNEEYEQVKAHPEIGYQLVKDMHFFKDYLPVIRYHHERIDGNGYPLGLKGNNIPLHARIMCVADSFDAMTSMRSYKKGMTMQEAVAELERCAGTQFDAKIVETFVRALKKKYGPHFQEWDKQVANF
jgi:HD-GYP domain-containing protein (c-di-GMP phosphodiesterase class II)